MRIQLGHTVVADVILLLSVLFLWGCSPQSVALVRVGEESQLLASKNVVFEGVVVDFVSGEACWTLSEKFAWGAPLNPKKGWWADLTIMPTCVRKGLVDEEEIRLKRVLVRHFWPQRGFRVRPYLPNNQRVLVGFDSQHSGRYEGLMIVSLRPSGSVPSTQQTPE
jgi:hypothetical protein